MNWTRRSFIAASGLAIANACAPNIHRSKDADVIILGAGLSGLHAARILTSEGAKVLVIEGSNRFGGRMRTLSHLPGSPEAGGQQVGQTYARIRATAADLGLKIVPPAPNASREKTIILNNKVFDAREWASHASNPFPSTFKRATPDVALFIAAAQSNPLVDQYAWREAESVHDTSAEKFLTNLGFDKPSLQLCDIALNANRLSTYSMLNVWRSLILYQIDSQIGRSEEIEGGSERLTEAMANSLPSSSVRLSSVVSAIDVSEKEVTVDTSAGSFRAPFCICSLPFGTLRHAKVTKNSKQIERYPIIKQMPYTQIHQIHLSLDHPINDGLPETMWTDTPIERVFPIRDKTGETVALTCWINGDGVRKNYSDDDWKSLAETTLLSTRSIQATAQEVVRWDETQPFNGGAYMHWAPKQISTWAKKILQPEGRLHFAGEHTSFLHTGMEGAMESGERAAYEVSEVMLSSK